MGHLGFWVLIFSSNLAFGGALEDCVSNAQNPAHCYGKEFERLDKDLNVAYRNALRKIDGRLDLPSETRKGVRSLLVDAQRNWIKFRNLDCNAFFNSIDGTGASQGQLECSIQLTKHRIEELSRWDR